MNKAIELNDFVYLMLATLANNSKFIDLEDKDARIVCLPTQYKQIIQNILCADNSWKDNFSILIDIEEYFDNHFAWEKRLSLAIERIILELDKDIEYDLVNDRFLINFSQAEVDMIMEKYQDEETNNRMEHFTSLLVDYIYTREFQEDFHDYSADAVKKMRSIKNKEYNDGFVCEPSRIKIKSFFKS